MGTFGALLDRLLCRVHHFCRCKVKALAECVHRPHTHAPDMPACVHALTGLPLRARRGRLPGLLRDEAWDWVAVTSPEAAAVFLEGWEAAGRPDVRVAVVGGGTGEVLVQGGCKPQYTSSKVRTRHGAKGRILTRMHACMSCCEWGPHSGAFPTFACARLRIMRMDFHAHSP